MHVAAACMPNGAPSLRDDDGGGVKRNHHTTNRTGQPAYTGHWPTIPINILKYPPFHSMRIQNPNKDENISTFGVD